VRKSEVTEKKKTTFFPERMSQNSGVSKLYLDILNQPFVNLSDLRNVCVQFSIPHKIIRSEVWQLLLGVISPDHLKRSEELEFKNRLYWNLVQKFCSKNPSIQSTRQQILLDIPRTIPKLSLHSKSFFRLPLHQAIWASLAERILLVWSQCHSSIGYFQGSADILTVVVDVIFAEDEMLTDMITLQSLESLCYWTFINLMKNLEHTFQNHYNTSKQTGNAVTDYCENVFVNMLPIFDNCLAIVDPELAQHLRFNAVQSSFYAFRWILCLSTREFDLPFCRENLGYRTCHFLYFSYSHLCRSNDVFKTDCVWEIF